MVNIVDSPFRVRAKDRKNSPILAQNEGIIIQKLRKMQKKLPKYLHNSKKSSNFAANLYNYYM